MHRLGRHDVVRARTTAPLEHCSQCSRTAARDRITGVDAVHASPRPALADGAVLFEAKCAACHAGGGNVVARGKTLDRAALTANNVDIATIVTMGKNQMPGFGEACTPKPACTFGARLSDADIAEVSKWVDARADDGKWSQ